jgi:predicted adenylyl cyclase CyaB
VPRNLEIKVRFDDISLAERIAVEVGAELKDDFIQIDTYFKVGDGRLKMREFNTDGAELIFYRRDETRDKRWSDYRVLKVSNAGELKVLLSEALGVDVIVEKRRRVFIYKNARIHIDTVKGLGNFIEFEVVDNGGDVVGLMDFLIDKFSLRDAEFVRVSYSDLLKQNQVKK